MTPQQIIIRPVLTEKTSELEQIHNQYTFEVVGTANKVEIRQAVEKLFGVQVMGVNTLTVKGKARRRGYTAGQVPDWKKAMVVLSEGQTIDVL